MSDRSRRELALARMGIDRYVRRTVPPGDAAGSTPDRPAPAPSAVSAPNPAAEAAVWQALAAEVRDCTACALAAGRSQTVFGVGPPRADWMVIGEAPGAEEDLKGEPFVGRAGKLLDAMLYSLGLDRTNTYIANIVKCRPPSNRDPAPQEAAACMGYLARQVALVRPRLILAVGRVAAQYLLHTEVPVGRLRGRAHTLPGAGVPVVVTYHPAYLLRSPQEKRKVWDDLCLAREVLLGSGAAPAECAPA